MHLRHLLAMAVLASSPVLATAQEAVPAPVTEALNRLIPGTPPTSVRAGPAPGYFEVIYGPEVIYVSADGLYLMRGDLIDVKTQTNLTEERRLSARLKSLAEVGEDKMLVFGPKDAKHTVTVFTDIDCPYCVKLHQEVPELNRRGIKVRYLAFPRAGLNSPSYRKTVSVWCAADRNQALTDAKAGKAVPDATCDNPVADQYALGQRLGVTGTPTLILDDGQLVPGYVPAARLVQALDAADKAAAKPGG
jgi:thiol:disulfide interchange protein DsbC